MIELDHPGMPPLRSVRAPERVLRDKPGEPRHPGSPENPRRAVHYAAYTVFSAFQPVFSVAHRRAVGYHATLCAQDASGAAVPSREVFGQAAQLGDLLELGRLTESLHVDNFCALDNRQEWLFLSLHPAALADSSYGEALLAKLKELGLPPQQVVLEVPEQAGGETRRFIAIVESLRRHGFLIALDGFGVKHSNIDRVWHLRPDIVTLERGIVRQATEHAYIERVLPGLVSLLHESGRLVLMGGLETEREALIALECNADFVQGAYFSRPGLEAVDSVAAAATIDALSATLQREIGERQVRQTARLAPYAEALQACGAQLAGGTPLATASAALLGLPHTARCFLLDQRGRQLGDNLVPPQRGSQRASRFAPLLHSAGASWERRPYFVDALAEPGRVCVTRPYLSINEAHLCVTASLAMTAHDGVRVLCVDIDWETGRH